MIETTEENGLIVSYDDETGSITMEWDEKTHPEYEPLRNLTQDEFNQMLIDFIERYDKEEGGAPQVSEGGSSCGTSESNCNPRS